MRTRRKNPPTHRQSSILNPQSTISRRRRKPYRYRWPDEVLARRLALNTERAAQEKLSGTTKGKSAAKKPEESPLTVTIHGE
jgi:hypothetical protein